MIAESTRCTASGSGGGQKAAESLNLKPIATQLTPLLGITPRCRATSTPDRDCAGSRRCGDQDWSIGGRTSRTIVDMVWTNRSRTWRRVSVPASSHCRLADLARPP